MLWEVRKLNSIKLTVGSFKTKPFTTQKERMFFQPSHIPGAILLVSGEGKGLKVPGFRTNNQPTNQRSRLASIQIAFKFVASSRENRFHCKLADSANLRAEYLRSMCKILPFHSVSYKFAFTSFHSTTILNHGLVRVINAQRTRIIFRSHVSSIHDNRIKT